MDMIVCGGKFIANNAHWIVAVVVLGGMAMLSEG